MSASPLVLLLLAANPLATVNRDQITESQLMAELGPGLETSPVADSHTTCRSALEAAIDRRLLLQEARRLGLAEAPEVAAPVGEVEQQTAAQQLYRLEVFEKGPESEAEARREAFHRQLWTKYAVKEPPMDWTLEGLSAALQTRSPVEVASWTGGRLSMGAFAERLDLDQVATLPPDYKARVENLRHELVRREVVKLEVAARGLARTRPVAEAVEKFRNERLLTHYLSTRLLKGLEVSPAEVRSYYDRHPDEFTRPERKRLLQILVPNEKKAAALQRKLAAGARFEVLARAMASEHDPRGLGADLGWFEQAQAPAELRPALALSAGEVTGPLPAGSGLRLIKVVEVAPPSLIPFPEVRGQIERQVFRAKQEERMRARLQALRSGAAITIDPRAYEVCASAHAR